MRPKRTGYLTTFIESNVEYKTHSETPATQGRRTEHIKYRGKDKKKTRLQPKAVRPSSQTHQNFEAATRYKSRINGNGERPKVTGYIPKFIDSSIGYKTHDKAPDAQYQKTERIKNRSENGEETRYQYKAVRPSSRTHQNFEAATHYKTRMDRKDASTHQTRHTTTLIDSIKYKTHDKIPAAQYNNTEYIINRGKTRQQTRYQSEAVRPSLRLTKILKRQHTTKPE